MPTKRVAFHELSQVIAQFRSAFWAVVTISAFLNVLLLGGSIYMMMVYDSALPSRSIPTLVGLGVTVIIIYIFQATFDILRTRILSDVGLALDQTLSRRTQSLTYELSLRGYRLEGDGLLAMRDLDNIRSFLSGSGAIALVDLPWVIFFLAILFLLHFWLGVAGLAGALFLIALTLLADRLTKGPAGQFNGLAGNRIAVAQNNLRHLEVLTALGMRKRALDTWSDVNEKFNVAQIQLTHVTGSLGSISRVFRMFLQSAVLTVGAVLVINDQASGGIIFASSIISGRALAPIDQAIANWRAFVSARSGWQRLAELLEKAPVESEATVDLPPPQSDLSLNQVFVSPPGSQTPTLQGVTFQLSAGTVLGVVGPSGAGKSSLGRTIVGAWRPLRGDVRLDGATIDQWSPDTLGQHLGYLPQSVELLQGTVAENICRFDPIADSAGIIAAAKMAEVHDLIVGLPQGYDTPVGPDGIQLSAGQRQRIGLARALYGNPFLLVLDEPNSNLDAAGEGALAHAIAAVQDRKGIVVVITHRPAVLMQTDQILVLRHGRIEAIGPRDKLLEHILPKPIASPVSVVRDEPRQPMQEVTQNG